MQNWLAAVLAFPGSVPAPKRLLNIETASGKRNRAPNVGLDAPTGSTPRIVGSGTGSAQARRRRTFRQLSFRVWPWSNRQGMLDSTVQGPQDRLCAPWLRVGRLFESGFDWHADTPDLLASVHLCSGVNFALCWVFTLLHVAHFPCLNNWLSPPCPPLP